MTDRRVLQDDQELREFVSVLVSEGVRSYLEIGSKFGGSLRAVASALPMGSRVVSVDMPSGTRVWPESRLSLERTIRDIQDQGKRAKVIWGDSTDPSVVEAVTREGPFDAVFIDANHTEPYVRKDWANYGPLGRIVAFHDINWFRPEGHGKTPIDVPKVWDELKMSHRFREIIHCPTRDNGIGVLWR